MRLPTRPRCLALATTLVAAGAAGCLSSNSVTGTNDQSYAFVRIVQVVSDAPGGVDFSLGTSGSATAVQFGTYLPSTVGPYGPYTPVYAATPLTFSVTGSTTPFYNQATSSITASGAFTIIALGRVTKGTFPSATVTVIADTILSAATTSALVRVFNAVDYVSSASTGNPVDVYIYAQGTTRPTKPDVRGLAWNVASPYLSKAAGNLQVDVLSAGTASTGTPLFSTTLTVGVNSVRTLVLRDPPAGAVAGTTGAVLTLPDLN